MKFVKPDAWYRGRRAAEEGRAFKSNPYRHASRNYIAESGWWEAGYRSVKK